LDDHSPSIGNNVSKSFPLGFSPNISLLEKDNKESLTERDLYKEKEVKDFLMPQTKRIDKKSLYIKGEDGL